MTPPTHCPPGESRPRETYRCRYFGYACRLDVSAARDLVTDGRKPVILDEQSVRAELEDTCLDRSRLTRVDIRYPGILAQVCCPVESGVAVGQFLIDGNHRAARCLELGLPFSAYLLTQEETERILLEGPQQCDFQKECRNRLMIADPVLAR